MSNKSPYTLPADAVFFITGCSSGIGQALAKQIAAHPTHRLVATARKPAALDPIPNSDRVLKLALDVSSPPDTLDAALKAALDKFGRVDVLVNNAGFSLVGDTEVLDEAEARSLFDTNFWGAVALTRLALPLMREENPKNGGKIGGVVLNVSSAGGFITLPGCAFYHASKFALEGFTEAVAKEMRPEWNIHLSIIEPGAFQSNFVANVHQGGVHPAYNAPDTPMRAFMGSLAVPDQTPLWAKPERVADVIYRVVSRGQRVPVRVPVCPDAVVLVRDKAEKVLREVAELEELSSDTGNPEMKEKAWIV